MVTRPKPFKGYFLMECLGCGRGFHHECSHRKGCRKCHPNGRDSIDVPIESEKLGKENEQQPTPRVPKRNNLKDPESTGRKRAAKLYPIEVGSPCEWQRKKNCGGGRRPIIGCYDGIQQHRHHGPVKRTTRNELGNVHRICDDCHVHWHELNDLIYDEMEYGLLPHDPISASDEEVFKNILDWKSGIMGQKFQLASSQNKKKFKEAIQNESSK